MIFLFSIKEVVILKLNDTKDFRVTTTFIVIGMALSLGMFPRVARDLALSRIHVGGQQKQLQQTVSFFPPDLLHWEGGEDQAWLHGIVTLDLNLTVPTGRVLVWHELLVMMMSVVVITGWTSNSMFDERDC